MYNDKYAIIQYYKERLDNIEKWDCIAEPADKLDLIKELIEFMELDQFNSPHKETLDKRASKAFEIMLKLEYSVMTQVDEAVKELNEKEDAYCYFNEGYVPFLEYDIGSYADKHRI